MTSDSIIDEEMIELVLESHDKKYGISAPWNANYLIREAIRLTREACEKKAGEDISTSVKIGASVQQRAWEQERALLKFELLKMTESRTAWKQLRENADEHIKKLEEEKARMREQVEKLREVPYDTIGGEVILIDKKSVMAVLDGKK